MGSHRRFVAAHAVRGETAGITGQLSTDPRWPAIIALSASGRRVGLIFAPLAVAQRKLSMAARHWVRPARSPKLLEFSNPNQKQRLSMKAFRSALDATLSGMSAPNLYAALIAR